MAVPKINAAEKIIWTLFLAPLDAICIFLGITLVLGPIGWIIKIFGKLVLSVYFFLKLGFSYLGGKRGGQKMAVTIMSTMVDAMPELDDFIPSLTIELWSMYYLLGKEAEEAEEGAKKAAANDNAKNPRLSRAA
jgi:hypothetical protein